MKEVPNSEAEDVGPKSAIMEASKEAKLAAYLKLSTELEAELDAIASGSHPASMTLLLNTKGTTCLKVSGASYSLSTYRESPDDYQCYEYSSVDGCEVLREVAKIHTKLLMQQDVNAPKAASRESEAAKEEVDVLTSKKLSDGQATQLARKIGPKEAYRRETMPLKRPAGKPHKDEPAKQPKLAPKIEKEASASECIVKVTGFKVADDYSAIAADLTHFFAPLEIRSGGVMALFKLTQLCQEGSSLALVPPAYVCFSCIEGAGQALMRSGETLKLRKSKTGAQV
ncbi:unnamed protein product, partial [Chrysoparadoxa australica]